MRWRWLWWLIPLYLLSLIVLAPASMLGWAAGSFSANAPHFSGLQGSLWRGSARQIEINPSSGAESLLLKDIRWRVSPWQLLTGTFAAELNIPVGNIVHGRLSLQASASGLNQFNTDLNGSMRSIIERFNLPVPLTIDGNWQLQISHYSLNDYNDPRWCDRLAGAVHGNAVQVRLNNVWRPLGDYVAELSCTPEQGIAIEIPDDNIMGMQVHALLHGARQIPRVKLSGSFQPTLHAPTEVTELLVFVGQPDHRGRYSFSFSL